MIIRHYKLQWTLQPITSQQVDVSLRETCASKRPHPANIWLSVSPLLLSLFWKTKPSFPSFCHPNVDADISPLFTFSKRVPDWNGTLRAAVSERAADNICRDTGHCSILGICSRHPNTENCLWDAQAAQNSRWVLDTQPLYVKRPSARLTSQVNHTLTSTLKKRVEP